MEAHTILQNESVPAVVTADKLSTWGSEFHEASCLKHISDWDDTSPEHKAAKPKGKIAERDKHLGAERTIETAGTFAQEQMGINWLWISVDWKLEGF